MFRLLFFNLIGLSLDKEMNLAVWQKSAVILTYNVNKRSFISPIFFVSLQKSKTGGLGKFSPYFKHAETLCGVGRFGSFDGYC